MYIKGARILPCPVPFEMSISFHSDPAYNNFGLRLVKRSFMASHILPLIPSSENNLKSNPSIQTVSKALRTSRKQLNTLLPRSGILLIVSNIVKDASIQPTPSLKPNCSSEKFSLFIAKFSNLLRRIISYTLHRVGNKVIPL